MFSNCFANLILQYDLRIKKYLDLGLQRKPNTLDNGRQMNGTFAISFFFVNVMFFERDPDSKA